MRKKGILFLLGGFLMTSCGASNAGSYVTTGGYTPSYSYASYTQGNYAQASKSTMGATAGLANDSLFQEILSPDLLINESYNIVEENPFYYTKSIKDSYFSLDSFTASYSNLRRYINSGYSLNADIIKTDELINYFSYSYPKPTNGEDFLVEAEIGDSPWSDNKLLTIAVTTKEVDLLENEGRNYVFLIDVSGSMSDENKLPLIQESLSLLLDQLNPTDTISVVTYSNGVNVVVDGMYADETKTIKEKIQSLTARGGTGGAGGIATAYEIAEKHFIPGGNNRIILATDGDFNIGNSSEESLEDLITQKRESGIYLTCLGFGMGNYKDVTLETLAKNGNGGYAYIDSYNEAKKVFIEDLNKTLVTVSKDTKIKVEFNEDLVNSYRLIGYENKQMTKEEFEDETKDSGEVGSGHTSVACYEINFNNTDINGNIFDIQINYKDPTTNESKQYKNDFTSSIIKQENSDDFNYVSSLVEFSLLLRDSPYKGNASYTNLLNRLKNNVSVSQDEFKQEFVELVETADKKQMIADPVYENYCIVNLSLGNYYVVYIHNRGEVLNVEDMLNTYGISATQVEGLYYDSTFLDKYKEKEVDYSINLFVKFKQEA